MFDICKLRELAGLESPRGNNRCGEPFLEQ